jgi:hypothetical protein
MKVRVNGAWKDVSAGRVRVGGQWKALTEARAYISGAWETIATFIPDLSLSAPASESVTIFGSGTATTVPVTATPTGGQTPFTYSWARVGAGSGTAVSPTSATTRFSRAMGTGDDVTEVFRCTCTDAFGTTATADVSVDFTSINPGDGF